MLDFEGTGPEVRNNLNTPTPVVHSAVIYCMRAMLDSDIPLNAGCLVPLTSTYMYMSLHLRNFIQAHTIDCSQNPEEVSAYSVTYRGCLRGERVDVTKDSRRCTEGFQRVCSEPGVHKVSTESVKVYIYKLTQACNSNLTFGAGGKDKEGKFTAGWGYYEVTYS